MTDGGNQKPPRPPRASWEPPEPEPEPEPELAAQASASEPATVVPAPDPVGVPATVSSEGAVATAAPPSVSGPASSFDGSTSSDGSAARSDDPLLPVTFSDRELREAVGIKPRPEPHAARAPKPHTSDDHDDGGGDSDSDGDDGDTGKPRKSRKMIVVGAFTTVVGLGIAALVVLGHVNKASFAIACKPQEVVAEQGRAFPPWGTRALEDDDKWKPIKIPPEAECRERETEDEAELSGWYLDMLVERATALLTVREVTDYAGAATILEQALLHARAPERRDQRKEIERLLGDVGYWRASAKLRDAAAALTDAAKLFDTAAGQRPRHVSDASAWATYARKLVDDLHAGPAGAKQSPFAALPTPERPSAPPGTALPVEPDQGSAGSARSPGTDGAPPTPPDAGVPTGGVLL
ncbi:MAG: hypothetical protein H6Q90_4595 [Deltaproteobacteria bacterium]|nr:hypothetical protein [Deltaproteobacteria bacterium]